MPTAVSVAKQCLTPEAAHVLDEAVAVARRRSHSQTTSLHIVSALLSLPASILRDACARARNASYAPRLQFKALDLSLGVSLDRLQSGNSTEQDPPVSNSLMAAIKRSQAHQRRLPENFRMYHEMSQQQNTVACVKVEIQQLILSILDDPSVNRVFSEAGFRSSEIKFSIIRPAPQVFRYRDPHLFLCDVTDSPGRTRLGFRYPGLPALFREDDKTNRRIGEVFVREHNRNPLLMGTSAHEALREFLECLEKKKQGVLPEELSGLTAATIEVDVIKQITERIDTDYVDMKLEELAKLLQPNSTSGLLLNYGDLEIFVKQEDTTADLSAYQERGNLVLTTLAKFLRKYGKRVWMIGSVTNDDVYSKFLRRFPCAEQLWDLHVLTVSSSRSCLYKTYPKSSLMESFVPFGGFFTSSSELKAPLSPSCKFSAYCLLRNEEPNKDILAAKSPFADPYRPDSSSSLATSRISDAKTKDDVLLRAGTRFPIPCEFQAVGNRNENGHGSTGTDDIEAQLDSGTQGASRRFLTSVSTADSVTTDLGLGLCSPSEDAKAKKIGEELKGHLSTGSKQNTQWKCDRDDYKELLTALTQRISWQHEAVRSISRTIAQRRTKCNKSDHGEREDVWLHFLGADLVAKKKIANALAEILCDSSDNLIHVDLESGENISHDFRWRGKTMVDFIFDRLRHKTLSVVFLENVDRADELLQSSLSQAVQSCKFLDSHGRALSTNKTIFITTFTLETEQGLVHSTGKTWLFAEGNILKAKRLIEPASEAGKRLPTLDSSPTTNKRKIIEVCSSSVKTQDSDITEITKRSHTLTSRNIDLNLPAEEIEGQDVVDVHHTSHAWPRHYMSLTHVVNVTFDPFNFNGLEENILDQFKD